MQERESTARAEPDAPDSEYLTWVLLHGGDDTMSRTRALQLLLYEHGEDAFPQPDPEAENRWVLDASRESLDGQTFIGSMTTVCEESDEPCPECGNTRHRRRWWNNGVVNASSDKCTICGYTHSRVDP